MKATFAAGCFWGVQDAFDNVEGVTKTTAGYTGGNIKDPTYKDVCSGRTGHAEAVEVEYDPVKVTFEKLLEVFWSIHDPTTPNRQGPDVGSQYRSAVFYHDEEQKKSAMESLAGEQRKHKQAIVTQILPAGPFYSAEGYHQHYHRTHGGSCRLSFGDK